MSKLTFPAIAVAGAVIGGLTVWGFDRQAGGVERAQVESIVHDYVLAHPEILPEAMEKLRDRESGKTVTANRDAIVTPFGSAWAGNPKGDVTLVEYFDYNCGYCRASLPMIAKLIAADPKVRVVFRELPILSAESRIAARASLAAAQQGKFATFHDALYAGGPVSDASIAAAASKAGVDTTQASFTKTADVEIAKNMETAAKLGMTGTPSWVVGDRVLSGALPLEDLQKAVAAARAG
ncbi:DsbA family protein [Sphingomonas faeni]|uniref:DsbA family protein n=1 Tax=Sphingomonas faeni TaxID=185950 RepID=UPI003349601F